MDDRHGWKRDDRNREDSGEGTTEGDGEKEGHDGRNRKSLIIESFAEIIPEQDKKNRWRQTYARELETLHKQDKEVG